MDNGARGKLLAPVAWAAMGGIGVVLLWDGTDNVPGVREILAAFRELVAQGVLVRYTVASLFRVTAGFYLAVAVSVPLGLFLGRSRAVNGILNPVIQFLRPISPLAWIPFALVWFGIGDRPAVFIIFLASFFPLLVSSTNAAAAIHPMYFQVAANLHFSAWERFRYVVLPASIPSVILALRVTLGVAWLVVVAAEMIAVKSGLGYLIIDSRNALRMDYVIVSMITIGAIGLGLDYFMLRLEGLESLRWKLGQR